MQGAELLNCVKEVTNPRAFNELIKLTEVSRSYCYFLIRLYKLVERYPKLQHCNLPIRFVLNTVKKSCENNDILVKCATYVTSMRG